MKLEELFSLKIGAVMQKDVMSIPGEMTVYNAVQAMAERKIGAAVIVDDQKSITGIFTERDLMTRVVAKDLDVKSVQVKDVMTETPVTLNDKLHLAEAFALFQVGHFRHVPIVDKDKLVGILSVRDINKFFYQIIGDMFFSE